MQTKHINERGLLKGNIKLLPLSVNSLVLFALHCWQVLPRQANVTAPSIPTCSSHSHTRHIVPLFPRLQNQSIMAAADVQQPPVQEPAPALPDYLTSPDAVLGDKDAKWRYGRAPDYSKTRKMFAESELIRLGLGGSG